MVTIVPSAPRNAMVIAAEASADGCKETALLSGRGCVASP